MVVVVEEKRTEEPITKKRKFRVRGWKVESSAEVVSDHRLEAESGARVRINRDRLVCEISGEPGRVQTAVRMVHELMARATLEPAATAAAINKGGNKAFTDKLTVNNNNNNNNNNSVNQRPLLKCTARHPRTVSRLHLTPLPFMVNNPKRTVPDKFTVKKRPLRPLLFTDNKYTVLLKHKCNASPHPGAFFILTPDWEEVNQGGQIYYWNTRTNLTQYERPV